MRQFRRQQTGLRRREMRQYRRYGLLPPRQAAQVGLAMGKVPAGQVHAREHVPDFDAMLAARCEFGAPSSLVTMTAGLPSIRAEQCAVVARHWIGHGTRCAADDASGRDRTAVAWPSASQNGENVSAARGRQEEVAVLDTRRDTAKFDDLAEVVMRIHCASWGSVIAVKTAMREASDQVGRGRRMWPCGVRQTGGSTDPLQTAATDKLTGALASRHSSHTHVRRQ